MKLNSLKKTRADMETSVVAGGEEDEFYPSLYLDGKQVEAMGLDGARVGAEMVMMAKVRVASVSENRGGMKSASVEVLEAATKPASDDDDASVMFPNG